MIIYPNYFIHDQYMEPVTGHRLQLLSMNENKQKFKQNLFHGSVQILLTSLTEPDSLLGGCVGDKTKQPTSYRGGICPGSGVKLCHTTYKTLPSTLSGSHSSSQHMGSVNSLKVTQKVTLVQVTTVYGIEPGRSKT